MKYGIFEGHGGDYTPSFSNIFVENINISNGGKTGIHVTALEASPVRNLFFKKVVIERVDECFEMNYYENIQLEDYSCNREMIEYFMEQTKGRVPVSFTDSQSPLNIISHLLPLDQFFISLIMEPEKVIRLFEVIAGLSIRFNQEQSKIIGNALVLPGHGFASSTCWEGYGMSDDNALMVSPEQYLELAAPSVEKIGAPWGGPVFHSCGDWSGLVEAVMKIKGLKMADSAFSPETDPGATNNLEAFHRFTRTGIVLNARIVGDLEILEEQVTRLYVPGMKLIVVTYCESSSLQDQAYSLIHSICKQKDDEA